MKVTDDPKRIDEITPGDPDELRLYFIHSLLAPYAMLYEQFHRIEPQGSSRKRKRELSLLLEDHPTLQPTPALSRSNDQNIRALVEAVACPQAIADLKSIIEDRKNHEGSNCVLTAMKVFLTSQENILRNKRLKVFAAIYLWSRFENIRDRYQENLRIAKRSRRRNAETRSQNVLSGKTAASYAMEVLVSEWLGISVEDALKHPLYSTRKKSISNAKEYGKLPYQLERICQIPIWTLIPLTELSTPTEGFTVHPQSYVYLLPVQTLLRIHRYLRLDRFEALNFASYLWKSRPALCKHVKSLTSALEAVYRGEKVQMKISNRTSEWILDQVPDSDELFSCLEFD